MENFDFYLYTSWYVLVHMHNKRRQELLSVKIIEVCFPRKKISRLSVKCVKTMLKHNTTHTEANSTETRQDLCNGDAHTSIKLCKEFIWHNHFIHPTKCRQDGTNYWGWAVHKGAQSLPMSWMSLSSRTISFFDSTTWPFQTKSKSLRNWQSFQFNVNILSSPSCWVVQKNFSPGPTPVLGSMAHGFINCVRLST